MSTVLIIGAGPNIGLGTAKIFAGAGYKVAIASRSKTSEAYKYYSFDASKPETVSQLFAEVSKDLGDPNVVIYNAYSRTATPENPFSLTLDEFARDTNINATSVYAAAKEAVKGFSKASAGGTLIFTGNKLNVAGFPHSLVFGMGKSASAHLIRAASNGFEGKGYKRVGHVHNDDRTCLLAHDRTLTISMIRFYYVDQRQSDGGITYPTGAEAHGNTFLELAQDPKQRSWHYTFVDGKGYVDFQER